MRNLTDSESRIIGAGVCYSVKSAIWQILTDGVMVATLFSPVVGVGAYVAGTHLEAMNWIGQGGALKLGVVAGLGSAIPLAILGATYSSAWNITV